MGVTFRVYTHIEASVQECKEPRRYPGPITNADIIDKEECYKSDDKDDIFNSSLDPKAKERFDFKVITQKQWEYLYGKYGGVPLKRDVYKKTEKTGYSYSRVDAIFKKLNLVILPSRTKFDIASITPAKPLYVSSHWTFQQVKDRITKILNQPNYGYSLKPENFRLWKIGALVETEEIMKELNGNIEELKNKHIESNKEGAEENSGIEFPGISLELYKPDKIIDEVGIDDKDKIIIELADENSFFMFKFDRTIPIGHCDSCNMCKPLRYTCRCKAVSYCSRSCMQRDKSYHENNCTALDDDNDLSMYQITANSNKGLTGLRNLGNTCFMNSGLQCLSNTFLLSKYFIEDRYKNEINETNPLGMNGVLAKSYAKLVKILWSTTDSEISPNFFKKVVGKFRAIFSSYSQQDSQELITTVLDGLHEDLNRVKNKPYVESVTTDDPNNDAISVDSWYCHLARNQSVIVDLMYGQYKSVLKCPKCTKYSVTFDPFLAVTLPICPIKQRLIVFFYVPYDTGKKVQKHSMVIPKGVSVDYVREKVAEELGVPKDGSTFVMLSRMTFDKFLNKEQKASVIDKMRHSYLYIQEINPKYFNGPENEGLEKRKEEEKTANNHEEPKDDYNNGLSDNMLRIAINVFKKTKSVHDNSFFYKDRVTFSRLIHVKRSYSMKEMHMEVFRYFRPIIEKSLETMKLAEDNRMDTREQNEGKGEAMNVEWTTLSDEEFFAKLFPGIGEEDWEEEKAKKFLYELRLIKITERYYDKRCFYCDKDCENCLVPYTEKLKVQDLLNKTDNPRHRNDYFFKENRGYDRKEFEFEVIFRADSGIDYNYLESVEKAPNFIDKLKEQNVTIYNCFDQFSKWENLDENNLWYCPTCKDFVQVSKRMEIFKAPPILILHLKRFKIKEEAMSCRSGERLDTLVDYPLENLDLSNYVYSKDVDPIYDLYAVSNHYGTTSFGHYTAFALSAGEWRRFDDSSVTKVDPSQVCSTAGYVLFYKRKDLTADTDLNRLKQTIPEEYKLKVVEIKKKEVKSNGKLEKEKNGGIEMKEVTKEVELNSNETEVKDIVMNEETMNLMT
jgi:ubiquitin carboxyl-terminal hydrolase 4/11/15